MKLKIQIGVIDKLNEVGKIHSVVVLINAGKAQASDPSPGCSSQAPGKVVAGDQKEVRGAARTQSAILLMGQAGVFCGFDTNSGFRMSY